MNGADLMLPDLILSASGVTLQTFCHVQRADLCSICLNDNRYPICISQTTMDGDNMYMSGVKGRGVVSSHLYQDVLWNIGPRCEVPYEKEQRQLFVSNQEKIDENVEQACAQASNDISNLYLNEEVISVTIPNESPDHPESMDEILGTIFFYLCQRKAKSYELLLLASHFYRIMQDCVPGLTLNLKLSSYKKCSKFLQHQQQINNPISLEETKPDILAIISFNPTNNEQLDRFRTPSWLKTYLTKASNIAAVAAEPEHLITKYTFPTITELWTTNSRANELLDGSSSTHYLRPDEIRQAVRAYVIRNNLNNEKQVTLDPILSRLFKTIDASSMLVGWNEVNSAVFDTMSPCTELSFVHLEQSIRIHSHIQPIELECIDRNRKRQTFIRHLVHIKLI